MLGVDRLDYTKGIDARLKAFECALESGRIDPALCRFLQVAVPSRGDVPQYDQIDREVDALVGRINGRFAPLGDAIVYYHKAHVPFSDLVALYRAADIMVVTPFKDGMNLVAKEFLATRFRGRGELILSEFAGAAEELPEARLVNPHDTVGLTTALVEAYEHALRGQAPPATATMHRRVLDHDVHQWARAFLARLVTIGMPKPPRDVPEPGGSPVITTRHIAATA